MMEAKKDWQRAQWIDRGMSKDSREERGFMKHVVFGAGNEAGFTEVLQIIEIVL